MKSHSATATALVSYELRLTIPWLRGHCVQICSFKAEALASILETQYFASILEQKKKGKKNSKIKSLMMRHRIMFLNARTTALPSIIYPVVLISFYLSQICKGLTKPA